MTTLNQSIVNDDVGKALGAPFYGDLSENALRVRRNLLALSLISLVIAWSGARLDQGSSILGVKFTGLPDNVVPIVLLIVNGYWLLHFIWCAVEAILEWRLRLTGEKVLLLTGGNILGGEHGGDVSDQRQATLYSWWLVHRNKLVNFSDLVKNFSAQSAAATAKLEAPMSLAGASESDQVIAELKQLNATLHRLQPELDNAVSTLAAPRLITSLGRFDAWLALSLRVQSLRWLILDVAFPVAFGILAFAVMARYVICL